MSKFLFKCGMSENALCQVIVSAGQLHYGYIQHHNYSVM